MNISKVTQSKSHFQPYNYKKKRFLGNVYIEAHLEAGLGFRGFNKKCYLLLTIAL